MTSNTQNYNFRNFCNVALLKLNKVFSIEKVNEFKIIFQINSIFYEESFRSSYLVILDAKNY
ncbi:hypothetical protein BpHYR1_018926 [Brachionus plicatilis]|uniref:Uncharacterized protein n=1 Tax=Brachionus plicatilis TaxID=10195 RepID=A0A3M7S7E2_BRAPC|nr:hypothetical protein BpHYR1_018926 [Brachionus plicatilis]